MVGVDHQITGGQIGVGLDLLPVTVALGRLSPPLLPADRGGELSLGEDRQLQLGPLRPGGETAQGDPDLPRRGHGRPLEVQRRGNLPLLENPLQILGPGLVAAEEEHAAAGGEIGLHVPRRGVQAPAVAAQLLGTHRQQHLGRQDIPGGGQRLHHAQREVRQRRLPLPLAQEQGGEIHALPPLQQGLRVLLGLEERPLHPLGHPPALAEDQQGVLWQKIEGAGGPRPDQLPGRQEQGGGDVADAPLGGQIELPHGVDLVIKEVAAHRLLHPGGEHVEDAPPQGELPHALHLLRPGVPGGHQPLRQGGQVHLRPDGEGDGALPQGRGLPGALEEPLRRGHQHRSLPPVQPVEGLNPPVLPLPGCHRPLGDIELPAVELQRRLPGEDGEIRGHPLRLALVAADHRQGPSQRLTQGGGQRGPVHRGQPGEGHRGASPSDGLNGLRRLRQRRNPSEKLPHHAPPLSLSPSGAAGPKG